MSATTKSLFLAEMQAAYGSKDWKCGLEPNLPGYEVCGAVAPQGDPTISSRWKFEGVPFRVLLAQFRDDKLIGVSYMFGSAIGQVAWMELTDKISRFRGPPASSATVSGWLAHTWQLGGSRRLVLSIQPNNTVEAAFAPESMFVQRFGSANAARLFRANDACKPALVDLCAVARRIVDTSAAHLPLRMNANSVLTHMVPDGTTVIAVVQLSYDKAAIDELLRANGATREQLMMAMTTSARDGLCKDGSISKAFMADGGKVRYDYRGIDGAMVAQVQVPAC